MGPRGLPAHAARPLGRGFNGCELCTWAAAASPGHSGSSKREQTWPAFVPLPPIKEFGFSQPIPAGLLPPQPLVLALPGLHRANHPPRAGQGGLLNSSRYLKRKITVSEKPSLHGQVPGSAAPPARTPGGGAKKLLPGFIVDRRNQSQNFADLCFDTTVRKQTQRNNPGGLGRAQGQGDAASPPAPTWPHTQTAPVLLPKKRL